MNGKAGRRHDVSDRIFTGEAGSFLVSFCNVRDEVAPLLALVTLVRGGNKVRWVEVSRKPRPEGITGLCYHGDKICVTHQDGFGPTKPAGTALLAPERSLESTPESFLPPDPHSVCSDGEALYFAVTSQDSIYKAVYEEGSREWKVGRYWTLPGSTGTRDRNHINGIGFFGGNLCVSGFEQTLTPRWELSTQGFVYDADASEYVMRGINHPHSLLAEDRKVWTCESRTNRLLSSEGEVYEFPSTYLRGLSMDDRYIYAGSSKKRLFSKSRDGHRAERRYEGSCALYRADRETLRTELVADFSEWCNEIYDILPLRPEHGARLGR